MLSGSGFEMDIWHYCFCSIGLSDVMFGRALVILEEVNLSRKIVLATVAPQFHANITGYVVTCTTWLSSRGINVATHKSQFWYLPGSAAYFQFQSLPNMFSSVRKVAPCTLPPAVQMCLCRLWLSRFKLACLLQSAGILAALETWAFLQLLKLL